MTTTVLVVDDEKKLRPEIPIGVSGEPVVVAALEDHRVVVGDAALAEQLGELVSIDEVAAPSTDLNSGSPTAVLRRPHQAGNGSLTAF
ncbi:hypothetical protein H7I56_05970 [Mycolicibacterium gilvum]|nr:hypothetical protein [Mycolicibacterium gilvum]